MNEIFINIFVNNNIEHISLGLILLTLIINRAAKNIKSKIVIDKNYNPKLKILCDKEKNYNNLKKSDNVTIQEIINHIKNINYDQIKNILSENELNKFLMSLNYIDATSSKEKLSFIEKKHMEISIICVYDATIKIKTNILNNEKDSLIKLKEKLINEFPIQKHVVVIESGQYFAYTYANIDSEIEKIRKK